MLREFGRYPGDIQQFELWDPKPKRTDRKQGFYFTAVCEWLPDEGGWLSICTVCKNFRCLKIDIQKQTWKCQKCDRKGTFKKPEEKREPMKKKKSKKSKSKTKELPAEREKKGMNREKRTFTLWNTVKKEKFSIEAELYSRQKNEWKAKCRFHNDKIKSLFINTDKRTFNCLGCAGQTKGIFFEDYQKPKGKPKEKKKEEKKPVIDKKRMIKLAGLYHETLEQGIRIILREERGLSDKVIDKYRIGYTLRHWNLKDLPYRKHKDCITIPIYKGKELVNVRYHTRKKKADPKDLPYQTGLEYPTWLYPEEQLKERTLCLTEGELDVLCSISQGLPAITVTGGAGSWKPEFTKRFKSKVIYIIFDCDKAGRDGAKKIAQELVHVAKEIRVIDLDPERQDGYDLTDWFVTDGKSKEELLKLIKTSPLYIRQDLPKAEKPKQEKKKRIFITGRQLVKEKVKELPAPVKKGLFVPERYTILAASDGEGKTLFCGQLTLNAITGTTFLGFFPIPKPVRVLYFAGENSRGDMQTKIRRQQEELEKILGRSIEKELEDNFHWVKPLDINFFLNPRDKVELHAWLTDWKPDIVIFDPLANFIASSKSLNDDTLARTTAKTLTEIAQKFKCFPIITTHLRKEAINPQTGRSIVTPENVWTFVFGSRYWLASAPAQIVIIRANLQRYPKAKKFCFKVKTSDPIQPLQFLRNPNLYYEELPDDKMSLASLTAEDVKDVLERICKGQQVLSLLVEAMRIDLGCGVTTARELINTAIKQGLIYKDPKDTLIKVSSKLGKRLKI